MEQLTKYEKARIIGARALQISMGAPFILKFSEKDLENMAFNPIEIAKVEFKEGVVPITVRRPLPGNKKKYTSKYFDQTKLE